MYILEGGHHAIEKEEKKDDLRVFCIAGLGFRV